MLLARSKAWLGVMTWRRGGRHCSRDPRARNSGARSSRAEIKHGFCMLLHCFYMLFGLRSLSFAEAVVEVYAGAHCEGHGVPGRLLNWGSKSCEAQSEAPAAPGVA